MNSRLFNQEARQDYSRITLCVKTVSGSTFKYIYDYPHTSYDYIFESLKKDHLGHKALHTIEIKFSGVIENRSCNEKFPSFETFLSFLKEKNLITNDLGKNFGI